MRRLLLSVLLLPLLSLGGIAQADEFKAGVHYLVLPSPVRTGDPDLIEIAEVFWYGCQHCYHFSPAISKWAKALPDDVAYVRSPAIWHPRMALHARAFYAAEALHALDKIHLKLFDAMNVRKKKLESEKEIAPIFVAAGIDRDEFSKVFNSFGVISRAHQAQARTRSYRITGTPAIIVNGKYLIAGKTAGSNEKMLDVAQYLIQKERELKN